MNRESQDAKMSEDVIGRSDQTVILLSFCLLGLFFLMVFFYKKLNKETNGEYTLRQIVYKKGGVRDRLRDTATALETRLGLQLLPRSDPDGDGEEIEGIHNEEGQVEEGSCQESESKDEEKEEENTAGRCVKDNSSFEPQAKRESEEREGQSSDEFESKEEEDGGRQALLINLNEMSGSAIWSEEEQSEISVM